MKPLVLALILLAFVSFKPRRMRVIPPGTVPITETFYADEFEVTNRAWQEYENYMKVKFGNGSQEHIKTLPDTSVWLDPMAYSAPYHKYYYRHVAYKEFPVVGVSHEQAEAFCRWRTDRVKEYYALAHKTSINLKYRLPTREEWETLAMNGASIFKNKGKNQRSEMRLNCAVDDSLTNAHDVTAPVKAFEKNRFGLYQMFGNLAEMISEPEVAKGGSWKHRVEICRAGLDQKYTKPESWLGFRCVCDYTFPTAK
jgi:formylglycine-generating enzyme required for sulfatase activity